MNVFAKNAKAVMSARGWTIQHVANAAGVDRAAVSRILGEDDSNPTVKTLEAIAKALEVPLGKLMSNKFTIMDIL